MTISVELAIIGALGTIVSVVLTLMGAARQRRKDRDEQHEATDRKIAELRQEMAAQAIAAAEARGSLRTWRSGVDDQLAGRREQHDVLRTENARQHTEILATAVDHIEKARQKGSDEHRQLREEMREDLKDLQASFDRMSDGLLAALSRKVPAE